MDIWLCLEKSGHMIRLGVKRIHVLDLEENGLVVRFGVKWTHGLAWSRVDT